MPGFSHYMNAAFIHFGIRNRKECKMKNLLVLLLLFCLACITTSPVFAEDEADQELIEATMDPDDEDSDGELARAAQNPLAAMISLPFQNNTNFNFGPMEKTQNVMNIQPVVPFRLNDNWNVITRTIMPIVSQPAFIPGQDRTNALGDTVFTAFLSPSKASSFIWGVGAADDTAIDPGALETYPDQ